MIRIIGGGAVRNNPTGNQWYGYQANRVSVTGCTTPLESDQRHVITALVDQLLQIDCDGMAATPAPDFGGAVTLKR
jgi:hypothetical protein